MNILMQAVENLPLPDISPTRVCCAQGSRFPFWAKNRAGGNRDLVALVYHMLSMNGLSRDRGSKLYYEVVRNDSRLTPPPGVFPCCPHTHRTQIPAMAKYAGGKGSIIITTSSTAIRPSAAPAMAGGGMYAASKAAAEMLMKHGAIEVSSVVERYTLPYSILLLIFLYAFSRTLRRPLDHLNPIKTTAPVTMNAYYAVSILSTCHAYLRYLHVTSG